MRIAVAVVLAALCGACGEPAPPTCFDPSSGIRIDPGRQASLLFVVPSRAGARQIREPVATELPRVVETLISGDYDHDGRVDEEMLLPADRLALGVITADLGAGDQELLVCPLGGDDGVLRTRGDRAFGCMSSYPSFLEANASNEAEVVEDLTCLTSMPLARGCGVEQPFEAALKALSPTSATSWTAPGYVAPTFAMGEGHGDGANNGFLWHDGALGVFVTATASECSLSDPLLLQINSPTYAEPLGARCGLRPEALHPARRYVDGLVGLRPAPGRLVFGALAGVPPETSLEPGALEALRSDPRMTPTLDPDQPEQLAAVCSTELWCVPPTPRVIELALGLEAAGARVAVGSVCASSRDRLLDRFAREVAATFSAPCVERWLPRTDDGAYACELLADLEPADCFALGGQRDGARCAFEAATPTEAERATGAPPADAVFYIDDYTVEGRAQCDVSHRPWVRFVARHDLPNPELRCAVPDPEELGVGQPCDDAACPDNPYDAPVACEPVLERCTVRCDIAQDCADAGLVGWGCDYRPTADGSTSGFCVLGC